MVMVTIDSHTFLGPLLPVSSFVLKFHVRGEGLATEFPFSAPLRPFDTNHQLSHINHVINVHEHEFPWDLREGGRVESAHFGEEKLRPRSSPKKGRE